MELPDLYAVYADDKRLELIAAFPTIEEASEWAATLARDFKRTYFVAAYVPGAGFCTLPFAPPASAVKPAGGDVAERNGYHRAKGGSVRGGRGCVQRDDDRLAGRQLPPLDTGGTGGVCPAKGPAVRRDADSGANQNRKAV